MPHVVLRVLGEEITVETDVPDRDCRLDEMLPFLRELDERVVDVSVRRTEAGGKRVSCQKGCSACCRAQPVPVTPVEAYALLRLVERMPEPQRTEVSERFAERTERLTTAGLAEVFLNRDPDLTPERAREIATGYFRLGLVCPFLVDDACSIYENRPFVCRHYLVTSPATMCADPFANPVEVIAMPAMPSGATLEIAEEELGTPQFTVPLVLALQYAESHRAELEKLVDPKDVLPRWVRRMMEGE